MAALYPPQVPLRYQLMPSLMRTGVLVPDPITFVVGKDYLNRPNLYPRQATLIKVIFLRGPGCGVQDPETGYWSRDLLTAYDHMVIDEWEEQYRNSNGTEGLMPGVRQKMAYLSQNGHKWFREVLFVMGRRAGKGHLTALSQSYVLWNYIDADGTGNPQHHYGVDRDKQLVGLVFAGKRDQAKATVFGDLVNVIMGSTCFADFISQPLTERLTIYCPNDFLRLKDAWDRGVRTDRDNATFMLQPRESTLMAGRGPTSFMQCFDEAAHIVASGANRSAQEVYDAAKPSLDQFGKDAFLAHPSSPWQMMGMFYDNWLRANEMEGEEFAYPDMLSIQLASWDIYKDWQMTADGTMYLLPEHFKGDLGEYEDELGPTFEPLRGAIQTYDEQMKREQKANPETFRVERMAQWATALDAYLNDKKVEAIFQPWVGRPERYGPQKIEKQSRGILTHTYKGHADPSKVNDKFGVALAHTEYDDEGRVHCVFDLLHHFDPVDFQDNIVDYEYVDDWIWANVIRAFQPEEFTFDQYNSTSSIQKLQKNIRAHANGLQKRIQVYEKTTTKAGDWEVKENAKAAINLGLVHCYSSEDDPHAERAELELKFLQFVNGRVDHPTSGPVQSKDIADCMTECINTLIGEQVNNFMHKELSEFQPSFGLQGGVDPFPTSRPMSSDADERIAALSAFGQGRGRPEFTPSRNPNPRRSRY